VSHPALQMTSVRHLRSLTTVSLVLEGSSGSRYDLLCVTKKVPPLSAETRMDLSGIIAGGVGSRGGLFPIRNFIHPTPRPSQLYTPSYKCRYRFYRHCLWKFETTAVVVMRVVIAAAGCSADVGCSFLRSVVQPWRIMKHHTKPGKNK